MKNNLEINLNNLFPCKGKEKKSVLMKQGSDKEKILDAIDNLVACLAEKTPDNQKFANALINIVRVNGEIGSKYQKLGKGNKGYFIPYSFIKTSGPCRKGIFQFGYESKDFGRDLKEFVLNRNKVITDWENRIK